MYQFKFNPITFNFLILFILIVFSFSACVPVEDSISPNDNPTAEQSQDENQRVELAKEFSRLLGEVMQEKQSRIALGQLVQHFDSFGDAVSVSTILGDSQTIPPSERARLESFDHDPRLRKRADNLSETLMDVSLAQLSNYPTTEKAFNSFLGDIRKKNAKISAKEALKEFYASQGLVVHIPYEEKWDWENYDNQITTTYDPIVRDDWNEGFVFNLKGARISSNLATKVSVVNDDYTFDYPTFVITYLDDDFYSTPPPTLPTPAPNAVILGYNVNHTSISQEDILLSNIPEMRLTSKDYIGLFATFTKVRLYRGSNKLKVNFDGTVGSSADGETFRYDQIRFSKDDIRDKRWKTVNIQFDPDWDMSENSQQLVFFTEHNLKGTAKAKASAKVGYDFIAKKPTAEFTTSVDLDVSLGGATFRTNSELSRRSVLAHIVGDTGNGTRPRNGNLYNIKPIGHLEFYFEHYFTDIPE